MRSTTYGNLVSGLSAMAGINPQGILAHEKALIAEYLSDATRFAYDYYPWAELLITEQRSLREDWVENGEYSIGSEVHHNGKYYRAYSNTFLGLGISPPENEGSWHEIGDSYADDPWNESSIYHIGARVKFNDKVYICIDTLAGSTASGMSFVNYEWDQIDPSNTTYWKEIDVSFDRYLPYEVEGYQTIGTFISAHLTDPRYTNAQTLNWREGTEGIYIEKLDNSPNKIWVKYRVEAPEYNTETTDETLVSKTLAPAIKAYAYKNWLIGDGQHEKAELQEYKIYEILVREVDKINGQQDRAVPYQIQSEPYRRVNARVDYIVEKTSDKIHQIHSRTTDSRIKFGTTSTGKQSVKRGGAVNRINFQAFGNGLNIVRKGSTIFSPKVWTLVRAKQALKQGTSFSSFKIFTGTPHRSIAIGFVRGKAGIFAEADIGIYFNTSASGALDINRQASSGFSVSVDATGRQAIKSSSVSVNISTTSNVSAKTSIVSRSVDIGVFFNTEVFGKQAIVSADTNSDFIISTNIDATENVTLVGQVTSSISTSINIDGELDFVTWANGNSTWADSNQTWS